jgi:hypothetical protein
MLRFSIRWVAATLGGFIVPFVVAIGAIDVSSRGQGPEAWGVPFDVAFPLVLGAAIAAMAACQWLVIRPRLPGTGAWVPATAGAMLIAAVIVFGILGEGTTLLISLAWGLAHALVVALLVGTAQWRVIQRFDPEKRWIRASIAAWLAAEAAGNLVAWFLDGGVGLIVMIAVWSALTARPIFDISRPGPTVGEQPTEPRTTKELS